MVNTQNKKDRLEKIKNQLTIEQVNEYLAEMGGEPQIHDNIIVSRTICHNPPGQGSFKLYYYDNTKLFKCYTDCPESSFDIFELTLKIKKMAGATITYWSKDAQETSRPWDLPDAVKYVAIFFGFEEKIENFSEERTELQDWKIFQNYEEKQQLKSNKQIVTLPKIQDDFLKFLPKPRILPWLREGITQEALDAHNICYNPKNDCVIIPHYDINNNLVGIRERTFVKENEIYGKYRPATINGKMYNHPLSFNLYNINISKDNIKTIKKAIVWEGEKSCLLYESYFGIDNDITVAACGSNLINYQLSLLLSLGVQEIIIAFDRQYQETGDKEFIKWTEKLTSIHKKYHSLVQISYLWDDPNNHLLDYKMSPIDNGKDVFLYLFQNRIQL